MKTAGGILEKLRFRREKTKKNCRMIEDAAVLS